MNKIIITLLFLTVTPIYSQCIINGPLNPTITSSDGSGTVSWNNTGNVVTSNNTYSTATAFVSALSSQTTDNLLETNFGFSIPLTHSICGIQVDVERSAQGLLIGSSIKDQVVQLIKGGVSTGSNYASGANWPSADSYRTYGGPADLWGTTWTSAEINASNFGVSFASATLNAGLAALFLTARIDHLQITVYSESTLPIELLNFDGKRINNKQVSLNWTTNSEINNDYFTIERSSDIINWETIGKIEGNGNSSTPINYSFIDNNNLEVTSFYRLKQTDFNGNHENSHTISVKPFQATNISIFPNPSNGVLNIKCDENIVKVELINLLGKVIDTFYCNNKNTKIDLDNCPQNIYFIKAYSKSQIYLKKVLIK